MVIKPKQQASSQRTHRSPCQQQAVADKQRLKNNITRILSNGIHSTYLLNTMTNYMMNGNGNNGNVSSTSFQNQTQNQSMANCKAMNSKSSQMQSIATTEMPSISSLPNRNHNHNHSHNHNHNRSHHHPQSSNQQYLNLNVYGHGANVNVHGLQNGTQRQSQIQHQHQRYLQQQQHQQQQQHHFQAVQMGQVQMNPYSPLSSNAQQLRMNQLQIQQRQMQMQHQLQQQHYNRNMNPANSLNAMATPFIVPNTHSNCNNNHTVNPSVSTINPYAVRQQQAMQALLHQQQRTNMQHQLSHLHHQQQQLQSLDQGIAAPVPSIAIASVAPSSPNHNTPSPPIPYASSATIPLSAVTSHSSNLSTEKTLTSHYLSQMSEGKDNETDESHDIEIQSVAPAAKQVVTIPDEFASAIKDDFSQMIGMQNVKINGNNIASRSTINSRNSPLIVDDESNESKEADRDHRDLSELPIGTGLGMKADHVPVPSSLISKKMPETATLDEIMGMTASLEEDMLAQELEKKGERVPVPVLVTNTVGMDIAEDDDSEDQDPEEEEAENTELNENDALTMDHTLTEKDALNNENVHINECQPGESKLNHEEIVEIDEIASAAVLEVTQQEHEHELEQEQDRGESSSTQGIQQEIDLIPSRTSMIPKINKPVHVRPRVVMPPVDPWQDPEFIKRRKRAIFDFLEQWSQYPTTSEVGEREQKSENHCTDRERTQSISSRPRQRPQAQRSQSLQSQMNNTNSKKAPPGLQKMRNGKPMMLPKPPSSTSKSSRAQRPPILHNRNRHRSHSQQTQSEGALPAQRSGNSTKPKYFLESPSFAFQGTFEEAKRSAIQMNRWIMLNIQDTDLFTAQWSNPLLWKHKKYEVIIRQNFIFFNCIKFQDPAVGLINMYNVQSIPSVCIIDPYSNVKRYEFVAPSTSSNIIKLREQILNLLHSFPNPTVYAEDSSPATKPTKPPILNRNRSAPSSLHDDRTHKRCYGRLSLGSSKSNASNPSNASDSRSPPHRPRCSQSSGTSSATSPIISCSSPTRKVTKGGGFRYSSVLEISALSHIYCNPEPSPANIWDVHYPYHNLKNTAYVLTTQQIMDWNDWMLILMKCTKIVGAIPSEQRIEFLRNRNGDMTLESSGTFNGWWSEQRVAEYVVNEKFGLGFEGGFASESGRDRKKFLKSIQLAKRPTFKTMLILIPNLSHRDRMLFREHSLSITPYAEYDKMDNITSFQLWLSFITFLSVNMYETSEMYRHGQFRHDQCTNFCFKLGNKWKLPLSTLYNDIEPLIAHSECKSLLFSFPKIATDAAAHCSASYVGHYHHNNSSNSDGSNKYHTASSLSSPAESKPKSSGLAVNFLSKSGKMSGRGFKYDTKRTKLVQSYDELESVLTESESHEVIDFPFPLFSSGWFSFNTLSLFATILEQHLDGTWVNMYSVSNRKQFKQIFETNKNTRRRSILYEKLLQQQAMERSNQHIYMQVADHLSLKNKRRFVNFWTENKLHWTDLVIDPSTKSQHQNNNRNRHNNNNNNNSNNNNNNGGHRSRNNVSRNVNVPSSSHYQHPHSHGGSRRDLILSNRGEDDTQSISSMHKNHNNLTYRKKKNNQDRLTRSSSNKAMRCNGKERKKGREEIRA